MMSQYEPPATRRCLQEPVNEQSVIHLPLAIRKHILNFAFHSIEESYGRQAHKLLWSNILTTRNTYKSTELLASPHNLQVHLLEVYVTAYSYKYSKGVGRVQGPVCDSYFITAYRKEWVGVGDSNRDL